jgi:hypothetical protein
VQGFLSRVGKDPRPWKYVIVEKGRRPVEGPVTTEVLNFLGPIGAASIPPGEGAGCPEKVGCTNIGQLGNHCFYICRAVIEHSSEHQ